MTVLVLVVLAILVVSMPIMAASMRLEVYGYLLALKPLDYEGWTYYGRLLTEKGYYQRAHYALKQAIAIRPHHTQAWFQLSELYSMMELDDKAADALARAIQSEVDFEK
jgi:tetratricopeptide (TPR) repeat protein